MSPPVDLWYCMVEYRDSEQNTEIVPAAYVKDLQLPEYHKLKVYDVFWEGQAADKPGMTLEEAKEKLSTIPTFPEGAGYEGGVGYYKAKILVVGETKAEVQKIFDTQRTWKPSAKAMESHVRGIASTSKASSSGVSSDTTSSVGSGTGTKRGRPPKKVDGRGAKRPHQAAEDPAVTAVVGDDTLFCASVIQEDHGQSEAFSDASVPAKLYEEVKAKYEKMKAMNKQQQERIDNLNKQLASVNELLIKWQTKFFNFSDLAVCCALRCCGGKPAVTAAAQPIVSNQVDMDTPVIVVPSLQDENVTVAAENDTVAAENNRPANPTEENSAPVINQVVQVVAELVPLPDDASPVQQLEDNLEIATRQVEDLAENEQRQLEMDPSNFEETAETEIEIHPRVKIPESLWNGDFKKVVEKSRAGYANGSQGDKKYIQDLAFAMWRFETLATHSVTGQASNANKGKVEGPPKPALEKYKIEAIQAAVRKRVYEEEENPAPGAEEEKMTQHERTKIERIRREIGVKISSVRKAAKNRQRPQ